MYSNIEHNSLLFPIWKHSYPSNKELRVSFKRFKLIPFALRSRCYWRVKAVFEAPGWPCDPACHGGTLMCACRPLADSPTNPTVYLKLHTPRTSQNILIWSVYRILMYASAACDYCYNNQLTVTIVPWRHAFIGRCAKHTNKVVTGQILSIC